VVRLRAVVGSGSIGPAPFAAHAVTDAVRAAMPDAGEEEWEYAAASAAAQASVALLDEHQPPRRVVLAVDVPEVSPVPGGDHPTVVAVLADSADAEPEVAAARAAVGRGSPDAVRLLERCLDHELGWWAAQEVDAVLEELGRR
jgi:hypothetical protein